MSTDLFNSLDWKDIGEILAMIALGVTGVAVDRGRLWAAEWWKNRKLHPIARTVRRSRPINNLLVTLRTELNADRCFVTQFHNGNVFSSGNPIWRMTRTQEAVADGVSEEYEHIQAVCVQRLFDGLEPLFDCAPRSGIYHLKCADCPTCQCMEEPALSTDPHARPGLHYAITSQLAEGPFKRYLVRMGVVARASMPLRDSRKNITGLVAAEWCDPALSEFANRPAHLGKLCEAAVRIMFELSSLL